MLGPVSSHKRRRRGRGRSRCRRRRCWSRASACSTTGWRPPSMRKPGPSSISRPDVALLDREGGQRGGDVELGERHRPSTPRRGRGREHGGPQALEQLQLELDGALRGARDPALEVGQLVGRVAHGAGHALAAGRRPAGRAPAWARGDLDKVAQQVVVADLEGRDAGLAAVALLERRDVLPALVAQRAQLVQLAADALADEAAVAGEERRLVDEARAAGRASAVGRLEAAPRSRRAAPPRPAPRAAARPAPAPGRRPGDRAGRRGPRARRESARSRSGQRRSSARGPRRAALGIGARRLDLSSRARIAAASVSGAASRSASSRAPAPVTVRSIARQQRALAGRRPGSASARGCAGWRRRSAARRRPRRGAGGARRGSVPFWVSSR